MKQRKGADGICGSVENELGPLRATSVLQRYDAQTGAIEEFGELFHSRVRRVGRLERTDPGIAVNVETDVPRFNDMACRKRSATNHTGHMLGENFFVADTVLHRTDGT